jgi:hypothetical protein
MTDAELREYAKKRLKKKAEFTRYLWTWVALSLFSSLIWFLTAPTSYFWPGWVIFGMGVGALFQGIEAYSMKGGPVTEAQVDDEIRKITGTRATTPSPAGTPETPGTPGAPGTDASAETPEK